MGEKRERKKSNKVMKTVIIIALALIICVGVGVTCFTVFYLSSINSKSSAININYLEPQKGQPVNILVAGVDIASNNSLELGKKNNIKKANAIVLLHYEPKDEKLKIISIPRDTMIKLNEKRQKINISNSVNGPKYLTNNVEELMNTKINYYVQLDYNAFRSVIDSLGGVDVNIDKNMNYDDNVQNLHINFDKGLTRLNGEKAEEYFRWVKNSSDKDSEGNDLLRIKNQQMLMESVINKFGKFSTIFRYPAIISSISKHLETNMTPNQILKYARIFSNLKNENISLTTAKGLKVSIEDENYFLLDTAGNAANLSTSKTVSKSEDINNSILKISILNGTDKAGLAKNYQTKFKNYGFNNIITGNAPKKPVENTKVVFYGTDENQLIQINNSINKGLKADSYEIVPQKTSKYDVLIILGNDLGI